MTFTQETISMVQTHAEGIEYSKTSRQKRKHTHENRGIIIMIQYTKQCQKYKKFIRILYFIFAISRKRSDQENRSIEQINTQPLLQTAADGWMDKIMRGKC